MMNIQPPVATAISALLYARQAYKWNFVQAVNGMMLYSGGVSKNVSIVVDCENGNQVNFMQSTENKHQNNL